MSERLLNCKKNRQIYQFSQLISSHLSIKAPKSLWKVKFISFFVIVWMIKRVCTLYKSVAVLNVYIFYFPLFSYFRWVFVFSIPRIIRKSTRCLLRHMLECNVCFNVCYAIINTNDGCGSNLIRKIKWNAEGESARNNRWFIDRFLYQLFFFSLNWFVLLVKGLNWLIKSLLCLWLNFF